MPLDQLHQQRGFNLTELMITIAIVGIFASTAMPSFRSFLQGQKVKATASDLQIALLRARSEGIKRNSSVTLSPVSGDWAKGWVLPNPSSQGKFLEQHGATNIIVSGPGSVTYTGTGRISGGAEVSFGLKAEDTDTIRCVEISLSGSPVVKNSGC